jgi:hypothetical protein
MRGEECLHTEWLVGEPAWLPNDGTSAAVIGANLCFGDPLRVRTVGSGGRDRGGNILRTLFMFMSMEWDYVSELRTPAGILFVPQTVQHMSKEHWWNDIDRRKPRNSEKETFRVPHLSFINSTWVKQGANQGFRGEMPVTKSMSHVVSKLQTLYLRGSTLYLSVSVTVFQHLWCIRV